ncbi:choline-sulfatase [Bordetella petrii]|nr:choline-sulfatase [Bordetella petrii]
MDRAKQPNILFIMADQMAAMPLPMYGGNVVRAPHLQALADTGVVFENAYCGSPICAPSRFSMLSSRLPTTIGAYDNASEFAASTPTLAHYLCLAGYRGILAGKMHFIGPDQLHGYEERLVTDIYPADFSWTPNWRAGPTDKPSGISLRNVTQAGQCARSLQLDYDDEVAYFARQKLYDLARDTDDRPFFLTVSFSHPHPPFTISAEYWNRYDHGAIDMPAVGPIPEHERDALSQWLHLSHGGDTTPITEAQLRNARHAYYGMISYIDDQVGRLLDTLRQCQLADDTVVVFTSDHGEMLGERGMWYKQNFFEPSVRVPLLIHAPGESLAGGKRVRQPVTLLDLLPTLLELAGGEPDYVDPIDGRSLVPLLAGNEARVPPRPVLSEYTDMGVIAPARMVRDGDYKLIYTHGYPLQLYHLATDPRELRNLAQDPARQGDVQRLLALVLDRWNPETLHQDILASQKRRLFLKQVAAASGHFPDWNFQAGRDDARRFVRANGAAEAKARARFPSVQPDGMR